MQCGAGGKTAGVSTLTLRAQSAPCALTRATTSL